MAGYISRIKNRLQLRRRLKYLRYQSRLEPVRRTTFLGHDFLYPVTSLIGQGIAEDKDHDRIFRLLAQSLAMLEAGIVVDVGANLGTTSLQLLSGNPKLRVLAFEPSRRYRSLLRRNLGAGSAGVEISDKLLGNRRGNAWLYNNSSSASVMAANYHGHTPMGREKTSMFVLDDVLEGRGPVSMIKTDCDGYDLEVLAGAARTIETYSPLLYFELTPAMASAATERLEWLHALGYSTLYCLQPDGRFLMQTRRPEDAVAAADGNPIGYLDIVCARDDCTPQVRTALDELMVRTGATE
jgi:FkbM family methyltransferase